MSKWISVKDRLPPKNQEVLVYWRNNAQKKCHYSLSCVIGDHGFHWFTLSNIERPWIEVLAWMELPKPPEEVQND